MNLCHEALEHFFPASIRLEWECSFEKDMGGVIFRVFEHDIYPKIGILEFSEDAIDADEDQLMFIVDPEAIEETKRSLLPN